MQLFSKALDFLQNDDEPTPEELEAEAKAERIQFHRERVRNGPVKFSYPTEGKLRRDKVRGIKAQQRKLRKRRAKQYMDEQRALAYLRGNLQAVGLLPYADEGFVPPRVVTRRAIKALTEVFGDEYPTKALALYRDMVGGA